MHYLARILNTWSCSYTRLYEENSWTRVLVQPGYKVYRHEIDEPAKRLKLWVRRKRGNKQLKCSVLDAVYGRDRGDL